MAKIKSDERDPVKHRLGKELRRMKKEEPEKLAKFLSGLSEQEAEDILYDQEYWLRDEQWVDISDGFPITLFLGARGTGKNFCSASTLKRAVEKHGIMDMLIIAPTARDFRANIAPSIVDLYPENHPNRPYWKASAASVVWPNGATAVCIPAEAGPDSVRGLNSQIVVADELQGYGEEIVTQALLTLRREPSKMIITTTPKAHSMIIDLVERAEQPDNKYVKMVRGTTYDNLDNLSDAFVDTVIKKYEGTRLGEQELEGKLILTNSAALFQQDIIDACTISRTDLPELTKIAIGLDPAMMATRTNSKSRQPDRTGIVVVGLGADQKLYAIEAATGSYTAEGWVEKTSMLWEKYSEMYPTKIVAEINIIGKEMLMMAFKQANKDHVISSIKNVFATQSKLQRASPFSLLSQQHKVMFVEGDYLKLLSMELTTYTGGSKEKSPDSMDAFIWACSELKPARKKITQNYELLI